MHSNRLVKLGDVCKVISGYAFKSASFKDGGTTPVLKIKNIKVGTASLVDAGYVSNEFIGKIAPKFHILPNDILISLTGSHMSQPNSVVGRVGRYPKDYPLALLNQRAGKVIPDISLVDSTYLFYVLLGDDIRKEIAQMASGAASQANISPSQVESVKILLPLMDIQIEIGSLLQKYDNLIENNNRRISILEDMAQSLYREWFVNFRYPGHADNLNASSSNVSKKPKLIDSPLGQIPQGWEVKVFSESFDFWNGKKCTKSLLGEFDLYGANGIVGKAESWKYENAVIIGRVGAYCGAVEYCFDRFWGSDNTIIAKCKTDTNISYLFLLLEHFNLNKYAGGSAQPLLTQTTLKQLKYIAPPEELINEFEKITHNFYEGVVNLKKRNRNLKKQRDMLLPKLISGQIELKD